MSITLTTSTDLGDGLGATPAKDGGYVVIHGPTGTAVTWLETIEEAYELAEAVGQYFRVIGPTTSKQSLEYETACRAVTDWEMWENRYDAS